MRKVIWKVRIPSTLSAQQRRAESNDGIRIGKTRIHLNVERWRVCEAWFSPSMAGVDSAGLGEVIQNVLARFSDAEKGRLVKVTKTFPQMHRFLRLTISPTARLRHWRASFPPRPNSTSQSNPPTHPPSRDDVPNQQS